MTQQNFLQTLFDEGDKTCFAASPYDTDINWCNLPNRTYATPYFSINALQYTRTDANVVKHRTFLIEFDTMPVDDQLMYMEDLGVPYSAVVFSGNKSYHFFVALESPVSASEYTQIARRLHLACPGADASTKNPSRLARLPGVIRPDTGALQEMCALYERIPNAKLLDLLPELPAPKQTKPAKGTSVFQRAALIEARKNPNLVMQGLGMTGRNSFAHWVGQRLLEDGHTMEFRRAYLWDLYNNLEDTSGFPWTEACAAARVNE